MTFLRLSGCSSQISLSTSPLETGGGEAGRPRALPRPVLTGSGSSSLAALLSAAAPIVGVHV